MKPAWTPDGKAFLYITDQMAGSYDVAVVPAGGGNEVVITNDYDPGSPRVLADAES